jgi:uroporphyrinogen-III synthase
MMTDAPLAGRGIAITRPVDQAAALTEGISHAGGTPISFPLLTIAPLQDFAAFDRAIEMLPSCNWIIFISTNAVQQAMPRIAMKFPELPRTLNFAAIGPATAQELTRYGIASILVPATQFDSESMLALPEFQDLKQQRVVIARGVGGRELLAETLRARGAEVIFAECYRRVNPQQSAGNLPELWQNGQLHAMVVTSSEALRNLLALAHEANWVKKVLICVNHARIAEAARENGLRVALADAPGDAAMLQCLIHHLGKDAL